MNNSNEHPIRDIAESDKANLLLIRKNVQELIRRASVEYDRPGTLVLDVAPQVHLGAREFFFEADVKTFDLDPKASPDYVGDLCGHNDQLPEGSFDLVICTEVLEHTLNPFAAVAEIRRVLKPGGTALITTPFNFRIHGPLPDCWRFTVYGLRELFKGFSKVEITEYESSDSRFLMPLQYAVSARK